MAASNQPPAQAHAASSNDLQEEERLENDLYRLNQMHLQLRQLRSLLPRMLEPLQAKHGSPQAAFAAYMQAVENASKEVASFRDVINSPETEALFGRAGRSQKENPRGIKQWRARDDPDWASEEPPKRPRQS